MSRDFYKKRNFLGKIMAQEAGEGAVFLREWLKISCFYGIIIKKEVER